MLQGMIPCISVCDSEVMLQPEIQEHICNADTEELRLASEYVDFNSLSYLQLLCQFILGDSLKQHLSFCDFASS